MTSELVQASKSADRIVLFIAWGESYIKQAIISLASLVSIYHRLNPTFRIIVLSDQPHSFEWLIPLLPLEVRPLPLEEVRKMSGEINFILRLKIVALQNIQRQTNAHVLFIDTDTIIRRRLEKIFIGLDSGACYLHKREWPLRVGRKINSELCPKDLELYLSSGTHINITDETVMWNSGVVGIPYSAKYILGDSLELCDKYYSIFPGWHVEQFSLSIILQKTKRLLGCRTFVFHYWHNKPLALKMMTSVEPLLSNHTVFPISSLRSKLNKFVVEATFAYYMHSAKVLLRNNKLIYNAYRSVLLK